MGSRTGRQQLFHASPLAPGGLRAASAAPAPVEPRPDLGLHLHKACPRVCVWVHMSPLCKDTSHIEAGAALLRRGLILAHSIGIGPRSK